MNEHKKSPSLGSGAGDAKAELIVPDAATTGNGILRKTSHAQKLRRAEQYLEAARAFIAGGISVIPGSTVDKSPALESGEIEIYRQRLATDEELVRWFRWPRKLVAICGSVSSGLEVIDFDHDAEMIFPQWYPAVESIAAYLPTVETPSGGYHVFYRCRTVSQKLHLAKSSAGEIRIETSGQNSLNTCPGGASEHIQISGPTLPFDIPIINEMERQKLFDAARAFDETPQKPAKPRRQFKPRQDAAGLAPWADFNNRCNPAELLESCGWKSHNGSDWTRPGKTHGTSATLRTTEDGGTCLVVFTSSAEVPVGSHSMFEIYKSYHHAGDGRSAASQLRLQGYGN